VRAQGLPTVDAPFTLTTSPTEPRNCNSLDDLRGRHTGAHSFDDADAFLARNERYRWLHRPIAMGSVDVGVAQAAGLNPYENFTWARFGSGTVLDGEGTIECCDDCCSHGCSNPVRVLDALDSVSHEHPC